MGWFRARWSGPMREGLAVDRGDPRRGRGLPVVPRRRRRGARSSRFDDEDPLFIG